MKVILAEPHGFCAGVRRAIAIVERALEVYGPPVYVRKEIVHNEHVIASLAARGARFVDNEQDVPEGAVCVYSAHGVSPMVRANAAERGLQVVDATCPLVSKVHQEARRFDRDGRTVVLIGHAHHEEVEGTYGHAPDRTVIVQSQEEARALDLPADTPIGVLTQTTLSVDESERIAEELKGRFSDLREPAGGDICYASTNRQSAVKVIAPRSDVMLVAGSRNSSNSVRMVEVALELGTPAYLVPRSADLDPAWLVGADVVGVSSGASAPESLLRDLLARLADLGYTDVETETVAAEHLVFDLPPIVRREPGRRGGG